MSPERGFFCCNSLYKVETHTFRFLGKVKVKGKQNPNCIYECVDNEKDEIITKKIKSLEIFNQGVEHYFAREFPKASVAFEEVLSEDPEDLTAKLFLEHAGEYISKGVPEGWTGEEEMS